MQLAPDHVWDARAAAYAARATTITEPFARDLLHAVAPVLLQPTTRLVLDVACGAGSFALAYLARFPRGIPGQTLLCTDRSPAMIAAARAAIAGVTSHGQCATHFDFAVQDAVSLNDVADHSVHVLVSTFGIFLVPQQHDFFRQVRRVLASNAPAVFATTAWTDLPWQSTVPIGGFGLALETTGQAIAKICHPEIDASPDAEDADPPWRLWRDPTVARQLVLDAGLHDVHIHRTVQSVCPGDKNDLWITMTTANPMVDISEKSEEEVAVMKNTFLEAFSLRDHEGAVFLVSAANIVTAKA